MGELEYYIHQQAMEKAMEGLEVVTEKVEVNGKNYLLECKPEGLEPSHDEYHFVVDEWYKNTRDDNQWSQLRTAMTINRSETLKDLDGGVIATCGYHSHGYDEKSRGIIGDGNLGIVLVKEDYKKHGLGSFLTKKAVDKIIERVRQDNFNGLVIIQADAFTKEGEKLINKMRKEYKGKVKFKINREYKKEEENQ